MRGSSRAAAPPRAWVGALLALLAATAGCADGAAERAGPVVFAAASLQDVVGELAGELGRREGVRPVLNLAASNTLAQQILAAPGADVFLSADRHWVEVLEEAGRVSPGSRRPLLGNRLVVVAARRAEIELERLEELAEGRYRLLALADPEAVPAGRYARSALESVTVDGSSLWRRVAGRVAPALDVRAALALVESDPQIVGIVYRTDALQSDRVRVLFELPSDGAARVTYYGAVVAGGRRADLGQRFLDFVAGPEGRRISRRHGFELPESDV